MLIVDGRSRTRQIIYFVDLHIERKRHVVPHQFEARMPHQMLDVALGACVEIIDAQHIVSSGDQPVAQVRAEKAGAAGYEDHFAF